VERALVEAVQRTAAAVYEHWFALDLIVEGGRCAGVTALTPAGERADVRARHVLVATGGAGQVFAVTTNPTESTGDGIAMALRAGVAVADLEFMQFHPTALHHPAMPRPLLSEALRGHGALLRDRHGERFVDELLPRDKVSQAIMAVLADQGGDHVWLDATGLERFAERFPTINAALAEAGLDPARDWLPVAPAAHYLCGGIVADLDGATSLPGLWVAGEAACNGVHGANRLASNSLLEAVVFAARAAQDIGGLAPASASPPAVATVAPPPAFPAHERALRNLMARHVGVQRDAQGLALALGEVTKLEHEARAPALRNLATTALLVAAAAYARRESRGAQFRRDHPAADPAQARRTLMTLADARAIAEDARERAPAAAAV
jgi:L-aspartate oxidase